MTTPVVPELRQHAIARLSLLLILIGSWQALQGQCSSSSLSCDPLPASQCSRGLDGLPAANHSLFVQWFNNSAFAPADSPHYSTQALTALTSSLSFSFPSSLPLALRGISGPFSYRAIGHLLSPLPGSHNYSFRCDYAASDAQVMLWVDDHLLCPESASNANLTLPAVQQHQLLHLRLEVIVQRPVRVKQSAPQLSVLWSVDSSPPQPVPASLMLACLSSARVHQLQLHAQQLVTGWDWLYSYDLLTQTLLPHSLGLTLSLYQLSTRSIRTGFWPEREVPGAGSVNGTARIGNRTFAGETRSSYAAVDVEWKGAALRVEGSNSQHEHRLTAVITPASIAANWSDFRLVLSARFLWGRTGSCAFVASGVVGGPCVVCSADGLSPAIALYSSAAVDARHLPGVDEGLLGDIAAFAFPESDGSAGQLVFSSEQPVSVAAARLTIASAAAALAKSEPPSHQSLPFPAEQYWVVRSVLSWLSVYTPYEGIVTIISRSPRWDFVSLGYVFGDWDNFFNSYIFACIAPSEAAAKRLAIGTFVQTAKSRTCNEDGLCFVPNWSSGGAGSRDHSEPPIAARVLWEMLQLYGADDADLRWLTELLYDDLSMESHWFYRHRRLQPLGLIALGSDPTPYDQDTVSRMQDSRYESGLDNSPMYDDDSLYNAPLHLMEQYDVGMTSLVIATLSALLRISNATGIGRQHTALLTEWLAQLSAAAASVLWDAELGLYVNVVARSGQFSRRLSPTSFFPMLTGLPSLAQAEEMTLRHLRNDSEFCVSASCPGLPLPSIARSDPAFADQEYWRGRHWAPHAMIVYWGLAEAAYSGSAVVRAARLQLVSQASALYRDEWQRYRHLHENYNGDSGHGCDRLTSEPLYSWAALNPLMAVLEWRKQQAEALLLVEAS